VQLCYSAACIDSLCNTYRARTARDMDISVVFHGMLFLAVVILPFCDSKVLIPNTALDVGSLSLVLLLLNVEHRVTWVLYVS
jgi:hypothetical protein